MKPIKVLVVDDSAFMRKLIVNFLEEDPYLEVVGIARNGKDAIEKTKQLNPDVITMDIEMPIMNGLEALAILMDEFPKPVIMLSSTTKSGAENTIIAMQNGAIDFIAKPSGTISLDLEKIKIQLINKVKNAGQVNMTNVKRALITNRDNVPEKIKPILKDNWKNAQRKKIICIGSSTGGPKALQEVLTVLPKSIKAPILIVQHMPPGFTKSLASRLDALSEITVKEAEDGEYIKDGVAYIAPGNHHLVLKQVGNELAISLNHSPPIKGHRPSVDMMFESLSHFSEYDKIAVILTGMGADGSKGLIELKTKGNVKAIAESENSCIVFGMPKSAIATNLVDEITDLNHVAKTIMKYMG
ncbi:chemotaxis response regulator protein-glutamate methylesterase [Heyndrickxia sporothermodurans]|uniref:protein-glutamate methylesterase/protein-glutamine glutaminase n=1 Tax=Heyndrickxia sporothermodurans TaxID=46224 RepID=UPI000D331780|nr:chemotaxis response regulator protein-glutamate methylesterase [Heyndrickxia sporothermodurans]PTY79777.1 chemotaxis response regulator protein-glutamate methylesterase [Heyndrickxia sporothermodurans]